MLVPGPLDAPTSAGCNAFLRSFPGQARVVCGIPELLEDLGLDSDEAPPASVGGSEYTKEGTGVGDRRKGGADAGRRCRPRPASIAPAAGGAAVLAALAPVERLLAENLARGSATADELAARTSLASATVLSALTLLELRGLVTSAYGRYSPMGPLATWGAGRQLSGGTTSCATSGRNSLKKA